MFSETESASGLAKKLLSLPTRHEQETLLRSRNMLDADGLEALLDVAERLVRDDPGKARRLAELCAGLSEDANAPAAGPRANYVLSQAHEVNGDYDLGLRLIGTAHDEYVALGMNLEALRTNVGKMAALLESGHYEKTLEVGQFVLDSLNRGGELEVAATPEESALLTALVQQNRGGCLEYMGRYEEALDAYALAEDLYEKLGTKERLGDINTSRGAIFSLLGRGNDALVAHETAARIYEEVGLALRHALALHNIGEAHLRLSNYASSLRAFEQARRLYDAREASSYEHLLALDMADSYLALNLHTEALSAYQNAERSLQITGMTHDHARALWGMGSTLTVQSAFEEAERMLSRAAKLFGEAGNIPLLSGVMLEQASLQAVRGDQAAALTTVREALDLVDGRDWPVQQVYARLRLADLTLPDVDSAEPHLLEARRLASNLTLPQLHYRLNERLGRLRLLQGRHEEARTLLEMAVDEIERLRGTVAQDAMRASFLRDKTAAYEDLLQLHLARDDEEGIRRAFDVAERAKSRALVDLLAGVAEAGPASSANPELDARLRDLQADLNATYNRLLGTAEEEHKPPPHELGARAAELEAEISHLRLRTAVTAASDPLDASTLPDAAWDRLPSDATLLAYHVVGDEILAFVGVRGEVRAVRRLGAVSDAWRLLRKLNIQWDRFRLGGEFADRNLALLERSARQVLAALYGELVAPLEPFLQEAMGGLPDGNGSIPKLAIVPHGPLHQVPFHALFDGERYLMERFEFSYAPSATVYAMCQERERSGSDEALVFGVEDPSIPAAAVEARAVAECLTGARVRVGEEATIAALRDEASGRGVLHLACHGLFRSDNPMFSSLKLHDGWLTAADAMQLELDGALVTLSACESGRGGVIGGDEVLGLARAFLGTGAATLVVSLWLAHDETTAALMENWYGRMRDGAGPGAALRATQLEIMEKHPHPYYWAPFVLTGRR